MGITGGDHGRDQAKHGLSPSDHGRNHNDRVNYPVYHGRDHPVIGAPSRKTL